MKTQKDLEKPIWDQMRSPSGNPIPGTGSSTRPAPKLMVWLILFVSVTYVVYTLKLVSTSRACEDEAFSTAQRTSTAMVHNVTAKSSELLIQNQTASDHYHLHRRESQETRTERPTEIHHIVFGIAASAKLWDKRKEYIKIWYRPDDDMRGVVWLDSVVKTNTTDNLPPTKISSDTSQFPYTNKQGHRSAIRISRIVSETLRLGLKNVRWFVMGDDDTVFITENLVRVLRKYDHNQYYYIGSLSESHLQNIFFSYGMAYGGGGFAISYPLAKALVKMQDRCIHRYPGLYGSDDRMQACMAELGVPLTKELGFHQYDVYGNLFGLLAAHPVTPLVSLHHLDVVEPIFPNMTRVEALQHLMVPKKLDSAAIMQQSICYDKRRTWTISVSWGFAVQVFRGIFSPREMEMPSRTFLNWYRRADYTAYAFNTRPVSRNQCQKPFVFYMSKAIFNSTMNQTVSEYTRHRVPHPECRWKMANPADLDTIVVYKKPDPHLWDRSPRRNCCRVLKSKTKGKGSIEIDVGICRAGEVSEV
ncbi:Beta-1,3-N-acetylglucosaminyltransferase lunatic fringe [Melia azedarach]|uniref:Beta-1,3-N-acetylglucosaminyltransferase lunatic fringe n=1 Tax=Melia azedarach TaxID=155640 RepID=A0ACC1XM88_MELAZ|nr:Beta-1,3-N-acetylglucosaminyltransferase lunatic fringe [Melia azedarach]